MSKTDNWEIAGTQANSTGEYFRLNLVGKGNQGAITVKDRGKLPGERFVCLTCDRAKANDCAHVHFVARHVAERVREAAKAAGAIR